jgi:hypothetical protein
MYGGAIEHQSCADVEIAKQRESLSWPRLWRPASFEGSVPESLEKGEPGNAGNPWRSAADALIPLEFDLVYGYLTQSEPTKKKSHSELHPRRYPSTMYSTMEICHRGCTRESRSLPVRHNSWKAFSFRQVLSSILHAMMKGIAVHGRWFACHLVGTARNVPPGDPTFAVHVGLSPFPDM